MCDFISYFLHHSQNSIKYVTDRLVIMYSDRDIETVIPNTSLICVAVYDTYINQ